MLRISKIETFKIGMPLKKIFTSGNKAKNITRCLVIRVTANDGTVGISSVDPSSRAVHPDTVEALDETIAKRPAVEKGYKFMDKFSEIPKP